MISPSPIVQRSSISASGAGDPGSNPGGAILSFCNTSIYRNVFISSSILLVMVFGVTFLIIVALIIGIWLLFGFKRFKHKLLAVFLIALVLFSFFSFNMVFKGKEISINNMSDLGKIFKIYFSWLGNIFGNMKTITGQAVKMDWQGNKTT